MGGHLARVIAKGSSSRRPETAHGRMDAVGDVLRHHAQHHIQHPVGRRNGHQRASRRLEPSQGKWHAPHPPADHQQLIHSRPSVMHSQWPLFCPWALHHFLTTAKGTSKNKKKRAHFQKKSNFFYF